ncbi:hypothetical protein INT47_012858 [Mucor saturninus]|uniref:Uncharacterized protein n=1 Tax=Mucor saturninus TaxID=64648 RepID=A0A8H7QWN8_9FUNG|nr:hypothetical protein INT47_012858 [Mucor saturninus]
MLIKVHPPALSENDYLRVVWSDFFEYLFPASGNIKIKTGETTYYKSTENKLQLYAHSPNTTKIIGFKLILGCYSDITIATLIYALVKLQVTMETTKS